MSFHFPSLLYRSTLIQREIDAEKRRPQPDRLRVMRLNTLRLKLMSRLLELTRSAAPQGPLLAAC
jgi:hypothetical protein